MQRLTWGEFKQHVEEQHEVHDDTYVDMIDIHGALGTECIDVHVTEDGVQIV